MTKSRRIRILQVVGGMNRGGTETWLMHILRHIDPAQFQMDFLVHESGPFAYEDEIRSLGSRTLLCAGTRNPWRYARNFHRLARTEGPYDIVHSHVQHFNGFVLRLAKQAGVPVRIAHSHLDTSPEQASAGLLRRMYFHLMGRWIQRHATLGIGVSRQAASALFGPRWDQEEGRRLLYCGVDLSVFHADVSSLLMRTALGIPADAFVIGHAGRMMEQKNHKFLIAIFAEVVRREPNSYLLLVGDGPLRADIEQQVRVLGLSERVIFAGVRADVPRLMLGAMDLFLLPSLCEGLPLVGMEAQAAGLPLIVTDTVTPEVTVIAPLVRRLSLASSAAEWANSVLAVRESRLPVTKEEALQLMEASPFNIERGVQALEMVYRQGADVSDGCSHHQRGAKEREQIYACD